MNVKIYIYTAILCCFYSVAHAGEWDFNAEGEGKVLYGYSGVSKKYKPYNKNNHIPTDLWLSFSAEKLFQNNYDLTLFADFMGGTDKYLKNYNQGSWGQQIYAKLQTPYGQFSLGQMPNVAYVQAVNAPSFGPLTINNSNIVDFINNPNWIKRKKETSFKTLNSTYINTDGDSPKFSYIAPEFYNTEFAFSYVPYTYNRSSLINKHAAYHNEGGIIVSAYNHVDFDFAEIQTSLGYANFFENDQEYSAGINLYRKGLSLGASYRRTNQNSNKKVSKNFQLPEFFDAYRNAEAYALGIGYEIGPFKAALSYFNSKAKNTNFKDEIIQFSNQFQLKKNIMLYAAVAHVDFSGEKLIIKNNNKGYAFVVGSGINF